MSIKVRAQFLPTMAFHARRSALVEPQAIHRKNSIDILCIVVLIGAYILSIILVDPSGDFPLNDDWSFAKSVRTLIEGHDWRPTCWAAMTQITHALLGAVACSLATCTHETLRIAVLLAGLAVLLFCFGLFRWLGISQFAAVLGAGAIVLNPVFFPLTFTFMTDVDFALFFLLSVIASSLFIISNKWREMMISTLMILIATMNRQLAIVVSIPLLVLYPLVSRERLIIRLIKGTMPFLICVLTLLVYEHWMRSSGRLPALYDSRYMEIVASFRLPARFAVHVISNAIQSGLYLGLVCLPLLLCSPQQSVSITRGTMLRSTPALWAHGVVIVTIAILILKRQMMPTLGNVFGNQGVGPFTLRDTFVLNLANVPELPTLFLFLVTMLSLLGLWLLVFHSAGLISEAWPNFMSFQFDGPLAIRVFGLMTLILYLLPLLPGHLFDRYVIVVAPLLCMSLPFQGQKNSAAINFLAVSYTATLALVAILGTHDYLSWNRARWAAIQSAESIDGAVPTTMDGGFEYNGDKLYDDKYIEKNDKSWWWVNDDKTIIAFDRLPGTTVIRRIPYSVWLPPGIRSIAVLRREDVH